MTIKELYDWSIENLCSTYELVAKVGDEYFTIDGAKLKSEWWGLSNEGAVVSLNTDKAYKD